MDKQSAINLIRETFEKQFEKEQFVYFIKNLFYKSTPEPFEFHGQYIPDTFKPYINKYERIGKYITEDKRIDILIVYLNKETSIERARTMQRNFVAGYLTGKYGSDTEKDAAIVAFVSPEFEDWRFSLVKMEYKLTQTKTGRPKGEEEFTPARRYSFLVGKNEPNHTAQSRLYPLLKDDINNPTLTQLEDAFNIETVTKEFFEKYRDLFLRLKESLEKIIKRDTKVKANFETKGVSIVDFAKKLLGQIVFLYFLQKKGWFGVKRGEDWGSGSKHFLRELFEKKHSDYKNFFNDILEPLFYEALRFEHPGDYYSRFDCRIPFLNGGLFDPINDYDWWNTDILLPNEIFSNDRKTKEGDTGDGILDIFDRYNFTVKEDEPLEKEVAIDPEMLGKVFENLLEIKDRKSKGTYYTPREIVHYMCQESLANYLATELSLSVIPALPVIPAKAGIQLPTKADIEILIKYGETSVEHNAIYIKKKSQDTSYKGKYDKAKLPNSIAQNAKLIDEKLETIRVCDPAVGSGAFLVGMMNEIIKTRNALTPYLSAYNAQAGIRENEERIPYHFKRQAIQNCLYGVDIDPGAVEIAKLRLWLSLVVDEEEREKIQPLPNLDYKIIQGNSLIEILTPELLVGTTDQEKNDLVKQVKEAKNELFGISSPSLKDKKRKEIELLLARIIEHDRRSAIRNLKAQIAAIKNQGKLFTDKRIEDAERKQILELEQKIQQIEDLKLPGPTEHFEWHLIFSEVFHEKKGFDVVIANPPYISYYSRQAQKIDKRKYGYYLEHYDFLKHTKKKSINSAMLFLERAINILSERKNFAYIIDIGFFEKVYKEIRNFISEFNILEIVTDISVFEGVASGQLLIFVRKERTSNFQCVIKRDFRKINKCLSRDEFKKDTINISFQEKIFKNLRDVTPLGDICDITCGLEYGALRDVFLSSEKKSEKYHKVVNGGFSIPERYCLKWNKDKNGYVLFDKEFEEELVKKKLNVSKTKKIVHFISGDENKYKEEKLFIRQSALEIIATYDDQGYYALRSIFCVIKKIRDMT